MLSAVSANHQSFTDYFLRGCKPPAEFRIGMEVEHLCVRVADQRRIEFDGGNDSVTAILNGLVERLGGKPVVNDNHDLVGIRSSWGEVSLEPGGQIEWSSPARKELSQLLDDLQFWLASFHQVLADRGVLTLENGFDGTTANGEIPWIPLRRYDLMRAHYASRPEHVIAAMGRTAGVHVSLDYSDAEDWRRKFRALLMLTPVVVALFSNSQSVRARREAALALGVSHEVSALRPALWLNLDPVRCQPPTTAFDPDFQLSDWAQWVANVPRMFTLDKGLLAEADGRTFQDCGFTPQSHPDLWELHLSTIYAPVRTNQHLEVRTIDMQSPELLPATVALFTGLLYSPRRLDEVLDMVELISDEVSWRRLFASACNHGLPGNPLLRRLASQTLELASQGLKDIHYDDPRAGTSLERLKTEHALE